MQKTCRTCRFIFAWWRCLKLQRWLPYDKAIGCYEPRETPLLVDELASALGKLRQMAKLFESYTTPPWGYFDVEEEVDTVLKRYQQEVGNASKNSY